MDHPDISYLDGGQEERNTMRVMNVTLDEFIVTQSLDKKMTTTVGTRPLYQVACITCVTILTQSLDLLSIHIQVFHNVSGSLKVFYGLMSVMGW